MRLSELTHPGLVFPDLDAPDRVALLRDLARRIVEQGVLDDGDALFSSLWEREELASTGIGSGVAVPHCKMDRVDEVVLVIAFHRRGIDFGAPDAQPVHLFFCIVSPTRAPAAHLQCLAAISRWVKSEDRIEALLRHDDPTIILRLLAEGEEAM